MNSSRAGKATPSLWSVESHQSRVRARVDSPSKTKKRRLLECHTLPVVPNCFLVKIYHTPAHHAHWAPKQVGGWFTRASGFSLSFLGSPSVSTAKSLWLCSYQATLGGVVGGHTGWPHPSTPEALVGPTPSHPRVIYKPCVINTLCVVNKSCVTN